MITKVDAAQRYGPKKLIGVFGAGLLVFGAQGLAAPVVTWHGPGANACAGRCSLEWALTQVDNATREVVESALKRDSEPAVVLIHDGAYFQMMSYFSNGEPRADLRGTVAVLDAPEMARGWRVGDAYFVNIDGCQNWALVKSPGAPTTLLPRLTPRVPEYPVYPPYTVYGPPVYRDFPPEAGTPAAPPRVPTPAAGWFLLTAISFLAALTAKLGRMTNEPRV